MPMFAAANPALVYGVDLRVHGVRYEARADAVGGQAPFGLFRSRHGLWTKVADRSRFFTLMATRTTPAS